VAGAAAVLARRAAGYADDDAAAFEAVQAAYRLSTGTEPGARLAAVRAALTRATEVPLAIAEAAAEVAGLADRLARHGNPNLRGDAVTGALLAEAGARAAATLVALNVASENLGESWNDRAQAAVRLAGDAARNAAASREVPPPPPLQM
jgi:formiminotetrahydrofolate cyclodeaminase